MPTLVPLRLPSQIYLGIKTALAVKHQGKVDLFSDVETALHTYEHNNSKKNLLELTERIAAWKKSKGGPNVWKTSERRVYMNILSDWLIKESEAIGIFPTSSGDWGCKQNCYVYAMSDRRGVDARNARPGRISGKETNLDTEFADGVIADALKAGKTVVKLPNAVDNIPGLMGSHYLVAMLANRYGYHFMRRNDHINGLWTHKNGGQGDVETCYYEPDLEKPVAITDEVANKLLKNPALIGCSMTFNCYFKVPRGGFPVL